MVFAIRLYTHGDEYFVGEGIEKERGVVKGGSSGIKTVRAGEQGGDVCNNQHSFTLDCGVVKDVRPLAIKGLHGFHKRRL